MNILTAIDNTDYVDIAVHDCEYYAIGDVHGCMNEYYQIIALIKADAAAKNKKAVIIQLGDMIDRGPYFEELILNDPADIKLMGNHEWYLMQEQNGFKQCRSHHRIKTHALLDASPNKEILLNKIGSRLPYFVLLTKARRFVFSHAPIKNFEDPLFTLEQIANMSHCSTRSQAVDYDKLKDNYSNTTYFHGHQSWKYIPIDDQLDMQKSFNTKAFNLDEGCVYGERLLAMRVFDEFVFSVPSKVKVEHSVDL